MRINSDIDYPTIDQINKRMKKPLLERIDEDWITQLAQRKNDAENVKNLRKSKIFR